MKKNVNRGILRFFQTATGRNVVLFTTGATVVGLFAGNYLPQTIFLNYYKEFMECYQSGVARPVPDKVKDRVQKAFNILNLPEYERKIIKTFTVFGFELFEAGSTHYRYGCLLGIPVNFSYSNANEINYHEIRYRDKEIDWNSESGKLLKEAIVLTEDEQIFGMCKAILQLQTHKVLLNSIFPSLSFFSMYVLGHYLNLRLNLLTRPFSIRVVMYTILGLFGLGSWLFMKDFNQVSYDTEIDIKLSALGYTFVEAGTTYYDKLLKKNIALRTLTGKNTYTAKGNENHLVRQKTLPLTIHKSFFEEKLKEINQNKEANTGVSN